MKNTLLKTSSPAFARGLLVLRLLAGLPVIALATAGCGTNSNLAGLAVGLNVAQKGVVAGLTLQGGTNSVTVGASYSQGTNAYNVNVAIPTGTNAP